MTTEANQDRFLGAILGMAIGDAVGMPLAGMTAAEIERGFGTTLAYHPRVFDDGTEIKAGEVTDETEIALCIIESFTVGQGVIDPENIGMRLSFLARGESRRWMHPDTIVAASGVSEAAYWCLPMRDDGPATGDLVGRGIPVGLMHAVGSASVADMVADAEIIARITHGSSYAVQGVGVVAEAVRRAARRESTLESLAEDLAATRGGGRFAELLPSGGAGIDPMDNDIANVVVGALEAAGSAADLEQCLSLATSQGGPTDSRAALAGALFGAYHGSAVIPQGWIDGLESRIYVSLAVPWFWRTVAKARGRLIDLRSDG
jgi:ADP-ribosylglycohydrolase